MTDNQPTKLSKVTNTPSLCFLQPGLENMLVFSVIPPQLVPSFNSPYASVIHFVIIQPCQCIMNLAESYLVKS